MRGGRWGTYPTAVRVGTITVSCARTHAGARVNDVGGVLRRATELLPNDSLTWNPLCQLGHISTRWWLPHDDRRDHVRTVERAVYHTNHRHKVDRGVN